MPELTTVRDRLIVALDVPTVDHASLLVRQLGASVSFYKIGMWLLTQPGVHGLVDDLIAAGNKVFLDYKMYDIGETVRRGVQNAAGRGVSIVTVHGDPDILEAAVDGRGSDPLQVFAITVLTSQDDAAVRAMGYALGVAELIDLRVRLAAQAGCDGVIASALDNPDRLRACAGRYNFLVGTPGIRLPGGEPHDQKRAATPEEAVARGSDYVIVGRPITQAAVPGVAVRDILHSMQNGLLRRTRLE